MYREKIFAWEDGGAQQQLLNIWKSGGVALTPTDTIYGFSCRADNLDACEKVCHIKGRDASKTFLLLASSMEQVKSMCDISDIQEKLGQLWPGPFTVVLPVLKDSPLSIHARDGHIGVRIPAWNPLRNLIETLGTPIVSTSANQSGCDYQHDSEFLIREFSEKVDILLTMVPYPITAPSALVKPAQAHWQILRAGAKQLPFA